MWGKMPILRIDIPALDRLVDYLNGVNQKQLDALTAQVAGLTVRLKASNDALQVILKGK